MTSNEFMNPNLHLTFTVKLACDNKHWRRNAADNTDGDAAFLTEGLKGALQDAVNEVLQREMGEESTAFADYSCDIVDDDKAPIYSYPWAGGAPTWCIPETDFDDTLEQIKQMEKRINSLIWRQCYPKKNGDELPYLLVLGTNPYGGCIWYIYDDNTHEEVDSGEGDADACQRRLEEIMEEETK